MARRSDSALPPAYTVADLMTLTGFGRDKVKQMMREGTLPGLIHGQSYRCPQALWDAWCERQAWLAQPRTDGQIPMIHRRPLSTKGTPLHEPNPT